MKLRKPEPAMAVVFLLTLGLACSGPQPGTHGGTSANTRPGEDSDAHGELEDTDHEEGVVVLSPEAASQAQIRTAPVEERILAAELTTTGQVDFDQTRLAHVSPRISGRVHRVRALLGEEVRAGQTLAEIDSIELGRAKAAYLQAKAIEELARKSFDRAQSLFADRIASEQEVLEAEAKLRETAAALHTSEETLHLFGLSQKQVDRLGYEDQGASIYPLRAPFEGTIVERHATLGELVTPERNLFTLADLSRVWIWIDVSQRDLAGVHVDDQARARVDAFPDQVFEGKVSYLSARVDADTRTVRARLEVANPEGKLRPGMFVEVQLVDPHAQEGGQARGRSLVVPEGAIVREGEDHFVFLAAGENRFERQPIEIGRRAGGAVEILRGSGQTASDAGPLSAGDEVVVSGAFLLKSAASKETLGGGHDH